MMRIDEIKELLYNQAIDGEFTQPDKVLKFLDKLTKYQGEVLVACYWIGFNNSTQYENKC